LPNHYDSITNSFETCIFQFIGNNFEANLMNSLCLINMNDLE
jgi:hypothetical protein